MKCILLQDVRGTGKKGQLVEVSDGFARNYLFPKKLAQEATTTNINQIEMEKRAAAHHKSVEQAQAQQAADALREVTVHITAKAGKDGRLFGAVTSKEIAEALQSQANITVDKKKLVLGENIKAEGSYQVEAKLHAGISAGFTVKVQADRD